MNISVDRGHPRWIDLIIYNTKNKMVGQLSFYGLDDIEDFFKNPQHAIENQHQYTMAEMFEIYKREGGWTRMTMSFDDDEVKREFIDIMNKTKPYHSEIIEEISNNPSCFWPAFKPFLKKIEDEELWKKHGGTVLYKLFENNQYELNPTALMQAMQNAGNLGIQHSNYGRTFTKILDNRTKQPLTVGAGCLKKIIEPG